jgi:FkbM family methyltransferase
MSSTTKENIYGDYRLRHRLIFFFRNIDLRGFRKLSLILPKLLLPKVEKIKPHFLKSQRGPLVWIEPASDFGVDRSIYETGTYESGTLDFMRSHLQKGDVFIDVGANIGWHSLNAAQFVGIEGKVWAFEPSPSVFPILEKNIQENQFSQILAFQCGIGKEKGEIALYLNDAINRGASSAKVKAPDAVEVMIKVLTLDEALGQQGLKVKMMKVDVEGMELEVLEGAKTRIKSDRPILIVECADRTNDERSQKDIYDYFIGLENYSWFKSKNNKERSNGLVEVTNLAQLPNDDNIYGIPK